MSEATYIRRVCLFLLLSLFESAQANDFEQSGHPILQEYCNRCHSTQDKQGELDLEQFTTDALAARQPQVWQRVLEQLGHGEMPPKDEPQLSAERKPTLTTSLQAVLVRVALANAGDGERGGLGVPSVLETVGPV